jgi:hypothetical protein
MERCWIRLVAVMIVAITGVWLGPVARAESEQYCLDFLRAVEAQVGRATAAKCGSDTPQWRPEYWSRDRKGDFSFCLDKQAQDIQYWLNERESQLTYCEAQGKFPSMPWVFNYRFVAEDVRISGRPGDYTIHWTLNAEPCAVDGGYDPHCFLQLRLETPSGRSGGYALQLARYESPQGFASCVPTAFPAGRAT